MALTLPAPPRYELMHHLRRGYLGFRTGAELYFWPDRGAMGRQAAVTHNRGLKRMSRPAVPTGRLPTGVTKGLWDYARADHVAEDYDDYFAVNSLFEFDEKLVLEYFDRPGRVADLGCGTGRLSMPFARRGYQVVGVDLSLPMLRVVGRKARASAQAVGRVCTNLVEMDCLRDESFDYVMCMFSTLGMIRGADHRGAVIRHARRILKPRGRLAVHVHNRWHNLFDPVGRRWLIASQLGWHRRGLETGDKIFAYRGVPRMFLHLFTKRELVGLLAGGGFAIDRLVSLDSTRQHPLKAAWWLGNVRANGWIALCHAAPEGARHLDGRPLDSRVGS